MPNDFPSGAELSRTAQSIQSNRARKLATLIAVCVSTFMLPLDYTVVAVALHAIQGDLSANFEALQWIVNGYTLTFAAFLLAGGALADIFGRRRIFVIGMALFALSSLGCGLAPNTLILNIARGIQGVGAAVMFSAALPLLVHEFSGPERAKAFGIFGAVVGIGAALGPFLGGLIISAFGWRWAFLINVPVTVALIFVAIKWVGESAEVNAHKVDWAGTVTFTAACFVLVYALISGNDMGWRSTQIVASLVGAIALFIIFVAIESRRIYPMFDVSLFRQAVFVGASIPPVALSIAFWGLFLYFPLYYQSALGYSPLQAGAAVLPFAIPLFFMGPVGGRLATRISSRALLSLGQALVGIGSLLLLMSTVESSWSAFIIGALVSGSGTGLINGEMSNVAMGLVPPERSGMASGISGTMRQVGVALGFAGLGAILASRTGSVFAELAAHANWVPTNLSALAEHVRQGDFQGGAALVDPDKRSTFIQIARASLYSAFMTISKVAGAVGLGGSLLTYWLMGVKPSAVKK
ncbi:MFS transporter [Caballeronia sp. 15715]|uniref:MFS transporter n=1 Tax=unclassified Caballeronia TaxID=2646786 RepID=UPI0039E69516